MDGGPTGLPPPPPQPASAKVSTNPKANRASVDLRLLTRGCRRRLRAHAATADSARGSINSPLTPADTGGNGGRGRDCGEPMEAAVVDTVTVTFAAEEPTVSGLGETVQVDCEGSPVQVKVTVPLNPPCPPTLKV